MLKMKKYLTIFLLSTCWSFLVAQDNIVDEVIWLVGDEAILRSDVEKERLNAQYNGTPIEGDPYCVIPEQLAILSGMGCHEVQGFLFSRPLPLEQFQQKLDAAAPPRGDMDRSPGKSPCGCRS